MDDPGMASVMLFCGLRWSEAAAVKGDAVDWFRSQLVVRRAVTKDGLRDYGKSKKSRRTVPLYPELLEALSARLDGRERDGLLFPNPEGEPWDYSRWRRAVWLPAVEAAKLPGLTPHDLRHTYASWLVEAGVDLYRVQVTMRYARFRPDAFGSVADVMRAVTHPVRTDESLAIESGTEDPS
jgi:integrase